MTQKISVLLASKAMFKQQDVFVRILHLTRQLKRQRMESEAKQEIYYRFTAKSSEEAGSLEEANEALRKRSSLLKNQMCLASLKANIQVRGTNLGSSVPISAMMSLE